MDERPFVSEAELSDAAPDRPRPRDASASEPETTEPEIERLRRELTDTTDRYLRALAELDNTKRRAQRDREEYVRHANESLIRELLPVLDNLDRALQAARASAGPGGVVDGVELIRRELLRALERFGVERYGALGARFDPARHEAVSRVLSATEREQTIIGETLPGYLLNGRVLRPAMVTVAVPSDEGA